MKQGPRVALGGYLPCRAPWPKRHTTLHPVRPGQRPPLYSVSKQIVRNLVEQERMVRDKTHTLGLYM